MARCYILKAKRQRTRQGKCYETVVLGPPVWADDRGVGEQRVKPVLRTMSKGQFSGIVAPTQGGGARTKEDRSVGGGSM